jgi:hypothetical protein
VHDLVEPPAASRHGIDHARRGWKLSSAGASSKRFDVRLAVPADADECDVDGMSIHVGYFSLTLPKQLNAVGPFPILAGL